MFDTSADLRPARAGRLALAPAAAWSVQGELHASRAAIVPDPPPSGGRLLQAGAAALGGRNGFYSWRGMGGPAGLAARVLGEMCVPGALTLAQLQPQCADPAGKRAGGNMQRRVYVRRRRISFERNASLSMKARQYRALQQGQLHVLCSDLAADFRC